MAGYVYLIGTSTFGWYKIGKAKTPEVRVKDLGILLPFKLKVFGVWKAENHHLLEKTLHEIYNAQRINGEWFEFTGDHVTRIFESLPVESQVYTSKDTDHTLATFSNVTEDIKNAKKVIGVRTQKLRGNFTPEEREQRRLESIARQKENKEKGLSCKGNPKAK